MENTSLVALLESDREMILGSLRADRTPQAAQTALEKALDRIALRYAEALRSNGGAEAEEAQLILKSIKSTLPLVDAVGEVRRWERTVDSSAKSGSMGPMTLGLGALGIVLELSVMLGLLFTGGRLTGPLTFIEALIPAAGGMAALFFAGKKSALPAPTKDDAPAAREEFLIDPEKVYHHLHGMLLVADNALENVRSRDRQRRSEAVADTAGTSLDARQAELFANLLEIAYARDDADSREMIQSIAFYLHGMGVELVNCDQGRESWFEFLPAPTPGTLRPAMVYGEKVIKKGLAAK